MSVKKDKMDTCWPGIPVEVDEDEETIKIVQLVKSQDTLLGEPNSEPIVGATIKVSIREKGARIIYRNWWM